MTAPKFPISAKATKRAEKKVVKIAKSVEPQRKAKLSPKKKRTSPIKYTGMHRSMIRANARNAKQLLKEGQEPDGKPFTKARIKYLKRVIEEGTWADER